jgi:hypothetical protein
MNATDAFNPEVSFLTVIMALLGGANSVWGPMLGVVPLILIKDYLSIAFSHHFSILLGLVLLAVVFFIPNGLIGLLQSGRAAIRTHRLADRLEALAHRLRHLRSGKEVPSPDVKRPAVNGSGAARRSQPPDGPHEKAAP